MVCPLCQKDDAGLLSQAWGRGSAIKAYRRRTLRREAGGSGVLIGMEARLGGCSWRLVTGKWFQKTKLRQVKLRVKGGEEGEDLPLKKQTMTLEDYCYNLSTSIPPFVLGRPHFTTAASQGFSRPVASRNSCPGHLPVHWHLFLVN